MDYLLAVDLGTTYTAAAVRDSSSASLDIFGLGNRAAQIPSVLYRQSDGSFLVGEPAERRGRVDPDHVVREFKRRIGDPVPLLVGGSPYSPQALTAVLLRWVVGEATERLGCPPQQVVLTHPANWTHFKIELLSAAAVLADLPNVALCTEPAAAAWQYAQHHPMAVGDRVCVFDLGGGTFDAAVLERTATGFDVLGTPGGIEQLGGVDFDESIFRLALAHARISSNDRDLADPRAFRELVRLRRDCVDAKEALSTETDAVISVRRDGRDVEIRITRSEFEDLIRPALRLCIDATDQVMRAASTTPAQLKAFVLVGGSSRIPMVAETLISTYHRTVARTIHPKHDVALGAAAAPATSVVLTAPTGRTAPVATDDTDQQPSFPVMGTAPSDAVDGSEAAEDIAPRPLMATASAPDVADTSDQSPHIRTGTAGRRSRSRRRLAIVAAALIVATVVTVVGIVIRQNSKDQAIDAAARPAAAGSTATARSATAAPSTTRAAGSLSRAVSAASLTARSSAAQPTDAGFNGSYAVHSVTTATDFPSTSVGDARDSTWTVVSDCSDANCDAAVRTTNDLDIVLTSISGTFTAMKTFQGASCVDPATGAQSDTHTEIEVGVNLHPTIVAGTVTSLTGEITNRASRCPDEIGNPYTASFQLAMTRIGS